MVSWGISSQILILVKPNRMNSARSLQSETLRATAGNVSDQTMRNRLHEVGLRSSVFSLQRHSEKMLATL